MDLNMVLFDCRIYWKFRHVNKNMEIMSRNIFLVENLKVAAECKNLLKDD